MLFLLTERATANHNGDILYTCSEPFPDRISTSGQGVFRHRLPGDTYCILSSLIVKLSSICTILAQFSHEIVHSLRLLLLHLHPCTQTMCVYTTIIITKVHEDKL